MGCIMRGTVEKSRVHSPARERGSQIVTTAILLVILETVSNNPRYLHFHTSTRRIGKSSKEDVHFICLRKVYEQRFCQGAREFVTFYHESHQLNRFRINFGNSREPVNAMLLTLQPQHSSQTHSSITWPNLTSFSAKPQLFFTNTWRGQCAYAGYRNKPVRQSLSLRYRVCDRISEEPVTVSTSSSHPHHMIHKHKTSSLRIKSSSSM
jgi:hypothetical protein